MLTIHCAACRKKLWKYDKIGHGHVARCHKQRIMRWYDTEPVDQKAQCTRGTVIGIDKSGHYRLIANAFTQTGTKRNR